MLKFEELELDLNKDGPEEISNVIKKIIDVAYNNYDNPELYSLVCEQMGSLIFFLIRKDRFMFGIKEKKDDKQQKNNHEYMH